jgi:ribose 5-phosphate isomerase B
MTSDTPDIEALVRQVVQRTLDSLDATVPAGSVPAVAILGEDDVRRTPANSTLEVAPGTVITPLARQLALERRIVLREQSISPPALSAPLLQLTPASSGRLIALGADHGGYELKEKLKQLLAADYQLLDCGTNSTAAVDYPDFAYAVARAVAGGRAWRGILIDGAGIGSCMAANKVPGVRAAMCYDQATAVNSREHNDANVLTLGAGLIGYNLAQQIVTTWLGTEFAGGRHARRVAKIDAIGARFSK